MVRYLLLLLVVAIVVPVAWYFLRHAGRGDRARFLRLLALSIASVFAVLAGAFIAGEALTDPGGWRGLWYVATWLLPLVALAVLAWLRPALSTTILVALTAAVVGMSAWLVAAPEAWRSVEDDVGPIRAVTVFVLFLPLALLGWHRPLAAGVMLLVAGITPVLAVLTLNPDAEVVAGSVIAVCTPVVVTAILYLTSAALTRDVADRTSQRPLAHQRPTPT